MGGGTFPPLPPSYAPALAHISIVFIFRWLWKRNDILAHSKKTIDWIQMTCKFWSVYYSFILMVFWIFVIITKTMKLSLVKYLNLHKDRLKLLYFPSNSFLDNTLYFYLSRFFVRYSTVSRYPLLGYNPDCALSFERQV